VNERFDRRLFLPDVRGPHRYLRVTWHREISAVVWSIWHDDVCVASTTVSLEDASTLIGLIVGALREAALRPLEVATPTPLPEGLLNRLRDRFRPQLAQVVKVHDRLRHDPPVRESGGA
jgi:hypothetical protein